MTNLNDIRRLAGLPVRVAEDDYDQDAADAAMRREQDLTEIYTHLLKQAGLHVKRNGVYFPDAGHIEFTLEETAEGYPLDGFKLLEQKTAKVKIAANHSGEVVIFVTLN